LTQKSQICESAKAGSKFDRLAEIKQRTQKHFRVSVSPRLFLHCNFGPF